MLNIIRADFYRILRGKALYITLAVLLVFLVGEAIAGAGTVGISTEETYAQKEADSESLEEATGMTISTIMAGSTDNLVYFLLPLIICIAGADFSSGAVKNVLARGVSRTKYYFAKLVPVLFFTILIQLLNFIVPVAAATIRNGFGGDFSTQWLASALKPYGSQLFLMIAISCVGIFITFVTKKIAAVNALFIGFMLVPTLIFVILGQISTRFENLINYDLSMNFRALANFSQLPAEDITRAFLLGSFYIIAGTIAGVFIFRKSDIK